MPSKSTKPISGRVDNETYFKLMELAKNKRMTMSQYIGDVLSKLTQPIQSLGDTTMIQNPAIPKQKPQKLEPIPPHVFNPNPLNDYGRVGVNIPPDITGYYKEEDVYKLELIEKKSVYGKWSNHLAIPKKQINRDSPFYFPVNANSTDLLEEFITGNEVFPIMYKVVANSVSFIDETGEQCVTFNGGYNGIVFGTYYQEGHTSFNKWYYRYLDLSGNEKKVFIKMY